MYIKSLKLQNFRNYDEASIEFSPKKNIFYGLNGQGKTNIIEALYFMQSGKSYRCTKEKETIKFGCDYAKIEAEFVKAERKNNVLFFLSEKKNIKLNGIAIDRLSELIGNINLVIFTPDHLNLINYYKVLKQRNNILKSNKKNMLDTISVWDEKLAELSLNICEMRDGAIKKINEKINNIENLIGTENIRLEYVPGIKGDYRSKENIINQLSQSLERDLEYRMTMTGPHRDDFDIFMNDNNIKKFGSQGQQRSCVLKLKLSECEIIKEKIGEMPPILLDDILSELDENRRKSFIENIKDTQVIITCTDREFLDDMDGFYFRVHEGKIYKE